MPRIMLRRPRILAFVVTLIVSAAMQPGGVLAQAGDSIDDPEAYAVYAAVVAIGFRSPGKTLSLVTLLQETRASVPCSPSGTDQEDWRLVVESYRQQNARVRLIQPGFALGVPYSLVTSAELRKLMQQAGYDLSKFSGQQSPGAEVFDRLPGRKLVALSAVGFNAEKTRAMITIRYDCFPSLDPSTDAFSGCHEGYQFMMEKMDGRWVQSTIGGCFWIA